VKVFASALGQVDNVGDTALRRAFLDVVRPLGDLQVFVGDREDWYLSGLGLAPSDVLHRSSSSWRRDVTGALGAGSSVFAFNAGEMELERGYALRYLRLAPLLLASRLRGGRAVHAGFGVRRSTAWRLPVSAALRLCDVVSWRDQYSRDLMGVGGVAPDWAFSLGSDDADLLGPDGERPYLAVALRYNGLTPDETWIRSIRSTADSLGLRIVVAAQILRDGPLAERLATELGGEAITWDGPDHATHEARLRGVYRATRLIVTDRLHAAVLALTEGALAVGLADDPRAKVVRTLEAAGITGATVDWKLRDPTSLESVARDLVGRRSAVMRHVTDARAELASLTSEIRALGRDRISR